MSTKYVRLAQALREHIAWLQFHGQRKLPSEAELMAAHGVSRQTVRQALSLLDSEGLIERRKGSGTYIRSGPSGSRQVAVITSYISDYIFPVILRDVQAVLADQGYSVSVYSTDNSTYNEREILLRLLREPVAGILVEGSRTALPNPNLDLYQQLRQAGIPMVFLHGAYPELRDAVCIGDDNYGGGYMLTRHLLEQGHQRIAGIFKSDDIQGPRRYEGVLAALRDSGLMTPDQHFFWYATEDRRRLLEEQDPELLRRFLQNHLAPCTAVICYNDEIAYPLIRALREAGRAVPEDVAVVSFDNSYYASLSPVGITSLGHDSHAMARTAANSLLELIRRRPVSSQALPWTLYQRESS